MSFETPVTTSAELGRQPKALQLNWLLVSTRSAVSFLSGAALLGTLTACSGGGGGGGGQSFTAPGYDKIACAAQPPDEGPSAVFANNSQTNFVPSFFFKPYDRFDLDAVLDASAVSTTDYVKSLGIKLFRIPRAELKGACQTFFNLDVAAAPLRSIWDEAAGGGGAGGGTLAGLYFEYCDRDCQERSIISPHILVDEASDRWTLIHELMHHNFNVGRKADRHIASLGTVRSLIRRHTNRLKSLMDDYKNLPNQQYLYDIAKEGDSLAKALYDLSVRNAFEEVAIEAQLIEEYAAGRLKGVSPHSPRSGLWYMNQSRNEGLQRFDEVKGLLNFVKDEADKNFWPEPKAAAVEAEKFIKQVTDETEAIIKTAEAKVENMGTPRNPPGTRPASPGSAPGESDPASATGTGPIATPQGLRTTGRSTLDRHAHLDTHLDHLEGADVLREFDRAMDEIRAISNR